jgi:hypothetical protein
MNKRELIKRLSGIEWDDFEVKEARRELPKDIARTVSAFANTKGGVLVFGVKEAGGKYIVSGVENPDKVQNDFITLLRTTRRSICSRLLLRWLRKAVASHKHHTSTTQAPHKRHSSLISSGFVPSRVLLERS